MTAVPTAPEVLPEPVETCDPVPAGASAQVEQAPTVGIRVIFTRFWPDTRQFRVRMLLGLSLVAVVPALSTANIYLFKILVDDVLTPHDYRLFPIVAAAYLGLTLLGGVVSFTDEYLTAWVGERFVLNLRVRVFAHLHRLSLGFFENHQLGDILSRLTGDVGAIEQLVLTGVNVGLTYFFQIVLFTSVMFYLNWQLTLAAFVAAPGFLLIARGFSRRIKDASRERRRRSGSISAVAEESLGNVALVQAYDRTDDETRRFQHENLGSFRAQLLATKLEAMFGPFTSLLEAIGVLLVMGIAVYELANNRITLGGLLVFIAYLTQLYGPIQGLGGLTNSLFSASASAERIIELLDEEPAVREPENPRPLGRTRGGIAIEDVEFSYPGTDRLALRGLSLWIAPGRKIAIVGASGAGKSTLTKLLLRSYDPDNGRITLDGIDLRDLALSDLRRNVTAVLQETLVFDGTIADNIRWGKPDATDQEIVDAAKAADAHEFVGELPDGYDTRIGQRGRMLSGGQRQRLAIARAMIRDSPVLLLDEPTTGLDAESSHRVLEPLRRLMTGRTTIIISHNLLTVTDADQIVFLDDGAVTAVGSHDELLVRSPGYARLYSLHHADGDRAPAPRAPATGRTTVVPAPTRPRPSPATRPADQPRTQPSPIPHPPARPSAPVPKPAAIPPPPARPSAPVPEPATMALPRLRPRRAPSPRPRNGRALVQDAGAAPPGRADLDATEARPRWVADPDAADSQGPRAYPPFPSPRPRPEDSGPLPGRHALTGPRALPGHHSLLTVQLPRVPRLVDRTRTR